MLHTPKIVSAGAPRAKSAEQALVALMRLCARAERCEEDARRLMFRWQVAPTDQETVLRRLKAERYIDNRRYAEAFVREKMALSGWGARKITDALRRKRIDTEIIREALAPLLSTTDMHQRVCALLQRKLRTTKGKTTYEVRTKLIRYALSQGYDYEVVRKVLDTLLTPDDSCDDLF